MTAGLANAYANAIQWSRGIALSKSVAKRALRNLGYELKS